MAKINISKEKALEILNELRDEANHLKNQDVNSSQFQTWRNKVKSALANSFGDPSRQLSSFSEIKFTPSVLSSKADNTAILRKNFAQGLTKSISLIEASIDEIEKYWEATFVNQIENVTKVRYRRPRPEIKRELTLSQESKCAYCFRSFPADLMDLSHIVPLRVFNGEADDINNLVVCCKNCHTLKDRRHHEENIFNPKLDKFSDHFDIDQSGIVTAKTDKGRLSVEVFRLNMDTYVQDRRLNQILEQKKETSEALKYILSSNFLPDSPSPQDFIGGRKEFAQYLHKKIVDIFNDKEFIGSFMLHLEGKWGSGKSTFLGYLKEEFEKKDEWIVVEFDSWRYQHFIPTWWGFLEQVRTGLLKNKKTKDRALIDIEIFWGRFKKILGIPFILGSISMIGLIIAKSQDLEVLSYILFSVSFASLLKPIRDFYNSGVFLNAKKIKQYIESPAIDPYEIASNYFHELIQASKGNKNIVIVIDDLDRCQPANAVKLLEGIQTLFKNKKDKILYVVSADKAWLKGCFNSELKNLCINASESVGSHFLEKMFQVNTRLPNINKISHGSVFDHLFVNKSKAVEPTNPFESVNKTNSVLKEKISSSILTIKSLSAPKEEVEAETKHMITKYHKYLGNNLRLIKRIVNAYELRRQLVALEMNKLELSEEVMDSIMKCCILEYRWPDVFDSLEYRILYSIAHKSFNYKKLNLSEGLTKELEEDSLFQNFIEELSFEEISIYLGL